jgi:DNA-binding transcriptional LysR family regulator
VPPDAGSGCHDQIQAMLDGVPMSPKVTDRVTSMGVMLTLVAAGYGIGFAIGAPVQALQRADIAIRPLAGFKQPTLTTFLLRRQGQPSEPIKRFLARVKALSGER